MRFLEQHMRAIRLMKRFHYLDHSIGPLTIVYSMLRSMVPFIPIVLSKDIIESIIGQQYSQAFWLAFVMTFIFSSGSIFMEYLNKVLTDRNKSISLKFETILHQKPLEIDYESVEDGEALKDFTNAITALKYKGSYGRLLRIYSDLLQALITLVISVGLTIELCFSINKYASGYLGTLTSPLMSFLILFLSIGSLLILASIGVKWAQKKLNIQFEEKLESERKYSYLCRMFRDVEMLKMIQSYDAIKPTQDMLDQTTRTIKKSYKILGDYWILEDAFQFIANSCVYMVAYGLVVLKIVAGAISVGGFIKYSQAVIKINVALLELVTKNHYIADMMVYFDKITQFLDRENKFDTGTIPVEKRSDHEYKLSFENVWFKYPGSDEFVLKDVNCEILSNHKCALVGPNGAGKSTLIKLLTRLYEPTKGRITLNGVDIRKYDYQEYLSLFSVVFQDFSLFKFSLGENIAASTSTSDHLLVETLSKTGLEKFKSRLHDSMFSQSVNGRRTSENSIINKVNYSGGEEQKIAIARALYKNGAYVILDEPTAALDPLSEYDIYKNFNTLIGDKTCIFISHRMSSCRFCTDIIVMAQGTIVERGNHEQLLNHQQLYSELWNAQAKYYKAS